MKTRGPIFAAPALALACACGDGTADDGPITCDPPAAAESEDWFEDRAEALGVTFVHQMSSELCHITDTVGGPGACVFDFDGDGDADVYLPNRAGHASALYRNDGDTFVDVAAAAGVDLPGDAIGCAAFDYDGDDAIDLFVTTTGKDRLYKNRGDGTFSDVTNAAGLGAEDGYSTSATAGDIDGDGDLDLFVGRLVKLETCPDECYLFPLACEAERSLLYINEGGVFTEEGAARGITASEPTLAVLLFDQDEDGDLDLYVGNDMGAAFLDRLYVNDGNGYFTDEAASRGYSAAGTDTMGVDIGDIDGDGLAEMVTTDFKMRPTRIYNCQDRSLPCSFEALPSESADGVSWGVGFEDFDADGDLDVFQTSGDVFDPELLGDLNQLFLNDGSGRFHVVVPRETDALSRRAVSRGAAFADLDGDLDTDVVVAVNGGRPMFLYNVGRSGHSARVDAGHRAAGALVTATFDDGRVLREQVLIGGSYLSTGATSIHFGFGDACRADVEVTYLDGRTMRGVLEPGKTLVVR